METLTGSCQCGSIKITAVPPYVGIINCHCTDCQKLHGNYKPMVAGERDKVSIVDSENTLSWYKISEQSERGFCNRCGSAIFKRPFEGNKILIAAGAFIQTGLTPIKELFLESAGDYYPHPQRG